MTEASAPSPAYRTARARARAELTDEIVATARRRLAQDGAAALSLRAVARDLGMVSSAVYRYFPSRDELLTRLIVDAYDALGREVEATEARAPRADLRKRFGAVCTAVRRWALANPHEYALIYGSPVPGYQAPTDTIAPATRVATVLVGILDDLVAADRPAPPLPPVPRKVVHAMRPVQSAFPQSVPPELTLRGLTAFSALFGAVSFELFGQLQNVIAEDEGPRTAFFDAQVELFAKLVGID